MPRDAVMVERLREAGAVLVEPPQPDTLAGAGPLTPGLYIGDVEPGQEVVQTAHMCRVTPNCRASGCDGANDPAATRRRTL